MTETLLKNKEWTEAKLETVARITRGSSPRPIQDFISKEGIPWVKIADATASGDRFISHTREKIKQEGERNSVKVFPGDLIVSNSATPGIPKIMKIEACIHDGWLLFRDIRADKYFLFYWLKNSLLKLIHSASGTVFKNLKTDIVKDLDILLPSLPEQENIAEVLSSLDSKIELLQKQNETLEEIAKAIFDEQFIKPTTDGTLPKNWSVSTIFDFAEILSGGTPKTDNSMFYEGNIPFFTPKDASSATYILKTERYLTEDGLNNCNSILFPSDTVFITARGTVGRIVLAGVPMAMNQSCYALKAKDGKYQYFLYLLLKNSLRDLMGRSHGSVFQTITLDTFRSLDVVIPSENIISEFSATTSHLFEKILNNSRQINILSSVRDTLLPQIMSGRIMIEA